VTAPRLHLPQAAWGGRVALPAADRKHLIEVLRLRAGDAVEVFDGRGASGTGRLVRQADGWWLELGPARRAAAPRPACWLGLALLKGRKLDAVVRMVTELGVAGVQPLLCQRSVPRPAADRLERRLERWRSIAAQAARQSGRSTVPALEPVRTLEQMLAAPPPGQGLMLHERADGRLDRRLAALAARPRWLLIGPEGGFAAEERQRAEAVGVVPVGLGLPVLQATTAAVVAAAFACVSGEDPLDRGQALE
jgi:16S rRNA (uracil1498-N3)-methyltransferase